jgi:serine/threonine-protein kinase
VVEASLAGTKVCAVCGDRFPSDALFCPTDGTPLQSGSSAEREAADPYLGQELSGHIEIRQLVGVGAMGRVYRAFQKGIDRDVAVKILHRELSANAQLVSRFTREAKVASRLQHPNVVSVLLNGQLPDRALYMVMEYLDGLSLQSALAAAGGALPLPRALHIGLQLCEAAGEAHAQGIVHRDLKPENVMLVRRGADPDFVKVLDFGIARINWGEQSVATAAGLIFGTARYISPEGAQGLQVGPASDVYSIATLLYQMLSGRTPFDGDQAVGLLVQQIHDPAPPLRTLHRAAYVPEPIADVIMASLAKDPAKREPDARALGQALFDAAKAAGLSPDELSRPHLKRTPPAVKMSSLEKTHGAEPLAAPTSPKSNGKPTAATVKWEPPGEFQSRLKEASRTPSPSAPSLAATLGDTLDDDDHVQHPSTPKTMPGDVESVPRTQYETPVSGPHLPRSPSTPDTVTPLPRLAAAEPEPTRSRWPFIAACFALGVIVAGLFAWKTGRIGADEEERIVARATDAMYQNHFQDPPGENVKEITDEGLKKFPNDRKLIDVRVRASQALTSQAIVQRTAGDVLEALRLARLAHELDPNDASTKRLVEQYESELATFSPSAAPTLFTPPHSTKPLPGVGPNPVAKAEPKALVDVSPAPKVGQTVELSARISPNKGDFADPGFTVSGPGVPGGVRVPATASGPGLFKSTYVFNEPGKFDVAFAAQLDGKAINAKRTVAAAGAGAPAPQPAPQPAPTPTPQPSGSVKWM